MAYPPALQMNPIVYDLAPPEGPKIVRFSAPWNNGTLTISANYSLGTSVYFINLQQQAQTGQFSSCQSVWIDNSTCPLQVRLQELETQQVIFVEPFSQSFYPVFASSNPTFKATAIVLPVQDSVTMANNAFIGTTNFFFMNVPCTPYVQLRDFTFNASFANTINSWTISAAFTQPVIVVPIPNTIPGLPLDNPSNYAVVLNGVNAAIANNGPATMNGVLGYILYAAPAANLGALSLSDGLYLEVLGANDAVTAITWAQGPNFRPFDPPIVCYPGYSIFAGPIQTLPAGNILQLTLNLNYSFVQIA